MDANCRTDLAAGVDPPPIATGGDWRTQLQPRGRSRIVNIIMEAMKNFLRVSKPEELNQLREIAAGFENRAYTAATNLSNYLRKISLRMLSMEMKTQQAPRNSRVVPDQTNSRKELPIWTIYGPIGWDPTAGTPPTGGVWRAKLQLKDRSRIVDMMYVGSLINLI
ncbi:mediator of RNA polymerase II transcription subunit 15a-like [Triticum dicoccoides]|uniref:mediator of RNA polymerase II transcription subunit 15a-like n=1 Tax=Triticum dicoccoides TaxID=85692 RepID=UPI001890FF80|nr:mediator of RNA polymerase II transcription subunit 15a-like [Triticum dicoccoides]